MVRAPVAVVLAVEPHRRYARSLAIRAERAPQRTLRARILRVALRIAAGAAGEIDRTHDTCDVLRRERHGDRAADRLPGDQSAAAVDIGLAFRVVDYRQCLRHTRLERF